MLRNTCLLLLFALINIFQGIAQEVDTLIINAKERNLYYSYIGDSIYTCFYSDKDTACRSVYLPVTTEKEYYIVREKNVYRYYYASWAKVRDSVYIHGDAFISTDEKPFHNDVIADEEGCHKPKNSDCTRAYPFAKDDLEKLSSPLKGTILRGLREGKWAYSSYDFAPIEEYYTNGIREGTYRVYIKKGDKDSTLYQTTFKNGTGIEKIYRDSYSTKYSVYRITHFKNGKQDLSYPLEEFHPNGNLARLTDYQKGLITSYYSTGILRSIRVVSFLDSLTNGKPTPVPKVASYFDRRGELISTYTFDKKGEVLHSQMYKDIRIGERGVWYLERGNFRYYMRGNKRYRMEEDGKEVEVEF